MAPNIESDELADEWVGRWPGIHKLTEELGELIHVTSQLKAYPIAEHPSTRDGEKPILYRLQHELSDVLAITLWFIRTHRDHLDVAAIVDRFLYKNDLYDQWHALGQMQPVWSKWPDASVPLNGLSIDHSRSSIAMNRLLRETFTAFSGEKLSPPPIDADFPPGFSGEFGDAYHDGIPLEGIFP